MCICVCVRENRQITKQQYHKNLYKPSFKNKLGTNQQIQENQKTYDYKVFLKMIRGIQFAAMAYLIFFD